MRLIRSTLMHNQSACKDGSAVAFRAGVVYVSHERDCGARAFASPSQGNNRGARQGVAWRLEPRGPSRAKMTRSSIPLNDASTAPRILRSLALRAQKLLSEPAYNDPADLDPREFHALLQQVAQLERRFHSARPTELQRWLVRVREIVEERLEQIASPDAPITPVAR